MTLLMFSTNNTEKISQDFFYKRLSKLYNFYGIFVHWSFAQNHLIKAMVYHFFKIQYTHFHYFLQGAKNTPWKEVRPFFSFIYSINKIFIARHNIINPINYTKMITSHWYKLYSVHIGIYYNMYFTDQNSLCFISECLYPKKPSNNVYIYKQLWIVSIFS